MTLTDRDRKIALALVPLLVIAGVWFLLLSPKRQEASSLGEQLSLAEGKRDDAVSRLTTLQTAKTNYAKDYAAVVRLGKAVPSSLDMPSLLVQLDKAAKGTRIRFDSVKPGARAEASSSASAGGSTSAPAGGSSSSSSSSSSSGSSSSSSSGSGSSSGSTPPVAAGGQAAQSGPGQATEKANGAAQTSDNANQAAGADSSSGTSSSAGSATSPSAPGLDSVPLDFTFTGSFFDLADFFHQMKRFVRVANDGIQVKGRLMTLDEVKFDSSTFPKLTADVSATVYLSPKEEGANAGGTTSGPSATSAATSSSSSSSSTPAPSPAPATTGGTQ